MKWLVFYISLRYGLRLVDGNEVERMSKKEIAKNILIQVGLALLIASAGILRCI